MFTVLWDPDLLRNAKSSKPMDFTPSVKPVGVDLVTETHIRQWFVDYLKNDIKGTVYNAHLAIADRKGVGHDACLKL